MYRQMWNEKHAAHHTFLRWRQFLLSLCRVSHSGGATPHPTIFFNPPPPIKTDARHGVHPPFKNEAPHLKNKHPAPLKRETPFHEMIPRKSTINYNLNLAKILEKCVWRSSFLVNLQACRIIAGNFTIKWTPSQVFFDRILSPPHAPPMYWAPPHVLNTCGKPCSVCLYETNIPHEGGHSIAHSIFKTCAQRRKAHFDLFLKTTTRCERSKNAYQIDCRRL